MRRQAGLALYCVAIALWLAGCASMKDGASPRAQVTGMPSPAPVKESEVGANQGGQKAPRPEPPSYVDAEACASRAVRVIWNPSATEGVTKYIVERAEASRPADFKKLAQVKGTTFLESGTKKTELHDSMTYFYRIKSVNKSGAVGPASQPAEVTTRPRPAAVCNVSAKSAEVRCVPLTWSPSPETDVVRYDIFRRAAPNRKFEKIAAVEGRTSNSFLDGSGYWGKLADEGKYEYRIRAINSIGVESADSAIAKAVTRGAPPVVTGVRAKSAQPREIPLVWEASPDPKVVGYEILRQSPGEKDFAKIASVTGRATVSFLDRGGARKGHGQLLDQTEYRYRVVALNTVQVRSAPSMSVTATTKPAPAMPHELAASATGLKSVRITWRATAERDIACSVLEAAASDDGRFREIARLQASAGEQLSAVETGLDDGEARFYRVKAVDHDQRDSAWSAVVAGTSRPLPAPPQHIAAQWPRGESILLTWAPAPDIKAYNVWKKTFFGADLLTTVSTNALRLSEEQIGEGLGIFISAEDNEKRESERSPLIEIAPLAVPPLHAKN